MHLYSRDETGCNGRYFTPIQQPIIVSGGLILRNEGWNKPHTAFQALISTIQYPKSQYQKPKILNYPFFTCHFLRILFHPALAFFKSACYIDAATLRTQLPFACDWGGGALESRLWTKLHMSPSCTRV